MKDHENFISLSGKLSLEQLHEKDSACLAFKRPAFVYNHVTLWIFSFNGRSKIIRGKLLVFVFNRQPCPLFNLLDYNNILFVQFVPLLLVFSSHELFMNGSNVVFVRTKS